MLEPNQNLRDLLAGERTMLAWVRTGLALMGFGFVVARFGLFLRELAKVGMNVSTKTGMSLWIGVGLVVLGIFTVIINTLQHYQGVVRLRKGLEYQEPGGINLTLVIPVTLVFFGAWMVFYLISLKSL